MLVFCPKWIGGSVAHVVRGSSPQKGRESVGCVGVVRVLGTCFIPWKSSFEESQRKRTPSFPTIEGRRVSLCDTVTSKRVTIGDVIPSGDAMPMGLDRAYEYESY